MLPGSYTNLSMSGSRCIAAAGILSLAWVVPAIAQRAVPREGQTLDIRIPGDPSSKGTDLPKSPPAVVNPPAPAAPIPAPAAAPAVSIAPPEGALIKLPGNPAETPIKPIGVSLPAPVESVKSPVAAAPVESPRPAIVPPPPSAALPAAMKPENAKPAAAPQVPVEVPTPLSPAPWVPAHAERNLDTIVKLGRDLYEVSAYLELGQSYAREYHKFPRSEAERLEFERFSRDYDREHEIARREIDALRRWILERSSLSPKNAVKPVKKAR